MVTQVTGYAGYNKKSFLELPTTPNKASEQSSSSAGEEQAVKIVIKEDISKRPAASKNSPSKKSSSKKSSPKKSSSKKSSHQNN